MLPRARWANLSLKDWSPAPAGRRQVAGEDLYPYNRRSCDIRCVTTMSEKSTAKKLGAGAALGYLLLKFLKILKFAKLAKIAGSAGSMVLSIALYSTVYGWRYAVGFVLLLALHEGGHYLAARQQGLRVGLPAFIPFVGAWIQLKEELPNARTEAIVGVAGPLLGTTAAAIVYGLARVTNSELLLALSYAGFFLNLFNLIPLTPLDGGRVTAAVSPRLWLVGAPVLVGWYLYRPNALLIVIAIVALPQVFAAFRKRDEAVAAYYDTPLADRIGFGVLYLLLVGFLAFACFALHARLEELNCLHGSLACMNG